MSSCQASCCRRAYYCSPGTFEYVCSTTFRFCYVSSAKLLKKRAPPLRMLTLMLCLWWYTFIQQSYLLSRYLVLWGIQQNSRLQGIIRKTFQSCFIFSSFCSFFSTNFLLFSCNVCKKNIPAGQTMASCRLCDWDRCEACGLKAVPPKVVIQTFFFS